MANQAVTETQIPGIPVRHGKVRDVYDFGDKLLLVATDRISAFDWILPTGIPDKGRILTQLSKFWFELLGVENHLISLDPQELPLPAGTDVESLQGRSMVVKKSVVVPIECVARGYLAGSGWKEYQQNQSVCGIKLPQGLVNGSRIPDTIFTPATKAEEGHDENISFEVMCEAVDNDLAVELQQRTLNIYQRAAD
ncbi:phosphoribosylaminoimidazolesuccinocarboxamide synthase, partial [Planctomicrobium sp.]|nr:phosphoribosylaminoimidazolesuccinocarboxamide synthase [Planctomicrobium sp.]